MRECGVVAVWRHHDTEDTGGLKLTPSQPRGASTASQQNTVQTSIHETDQLAVGGGDQTILVFLYSLVVWSEIREIHTVGQYWRSLPYNLGVWDWWTGEDQEGEDKWREGGVSSD